MNEFLETCPRCDGHGVLQTGSLAGNECSNCVNGYVLTEMGRTLGRLLLREAEDLRLGVM